MNKSHVAAAIKSIRLYRGMTQEELARKLFVTRQTVSNYETGRSNPDIETLRRISEILEVDVSDIIYGNGEILTSVISKKRMTMSAIIFCAYVILTLTLFLLTNELKNRGGPFAPYILVRVLLIPSGMAGFGWLSIKTAEFIFGRKRPALKWQKPGKIICISIASLNIIFSMPYVLWIALLCLRTLFEGPVQAQFPDVPAFREISLFFLNLMYNYPFAYIFIGIAFGAVFSNGDYIRRVKGEEHND